MYRRIRDLEKYLMRLSKKLLGTSVQYWKKFGSPDPDVSKVNRDGNSKTKSLFLFPGREQARDPIDFDGIDKQECTKVYL